MVLNDMDIINEMERVTGVKYSDEQLDILKHPGGMCILASAGSGKTTVLTHLLAKRIISGEIKNTKKLLCTTYSRAGSQEMEERLEKLFKALGIKQKVQVKTMHASYYMILRKFGIVNKVCSAGQRFRFISQSCKEAKVSLSEEELNTLDSLISYQVNNMLSDEELTKTYVYTLENLSEDKYREIRRGYNLKKEEHGLVDFDDMQLYMYMFLVAEQRPDILDYCRSLWEYFYIDEFQDVSKIQFEITRKLVTDPNKLVVIGDDDQCLIEGTMVKTVDGYKPIESVVVGEKILAGIGRSETGEFEVDYISKKEIKEDIVVIKTSKGKEIRGTANHIGFARGSDNLKRNKEGNSIVLKMFGSHQDNVVNKGETYKNELVLNDDRRILQRIAKDKFNKSNENLKYAHGKYILEHKDVDILEKTIGKMREECKKNKIKLNINREAKFNSNEYRFIPLGYIEKGMYVPVLNDGNIAEEEVVEVSREEYSGYVYDISVPKARNFIANDIVVHNCIYQWRGADPSIILNICGYYDIQRFVLSTNYRCGSEIVNLASVGIKNNSKRHDKHMIPFHEGGEISLIETKGNLYDISLKVKNHILHLIKDKNVRHRDIVVMSRNNAHLAILNNMLFREGIYSNSAPEMRFTNIMYYKDIKNIIELAKYTTASHIVSDIMWKISRYLGVRGSKAIADFIYMSGCNIKDALGYILTTRGVGVNWDKELKIPEKANNKVLYYFRTVSDDIIRGLEVVYKVLDVDSMEERINLLLNLYIVGTEFINNTKDRERTVYGVVAYLNSLMAEIGLNEVEKLFRLSEQYDSNEWDSPDTKLNMTTIHGAKGKEWDNVIIMNDDNITFPSFDGINKMGIEGVSMEDISGYIDEERRLHYVAMTRAKSNLFIFTNPENMSVYTLEALRLLSKGNNNNNEHIINMAKNGEVGRDIIQIVRENIFKEGSRYMYTG